MSNIFIIGEKQLGSGSYGKVYLGKNDNHKNVAIKCCDIENNGICNILELAIMKSLSHPCLNAAIEICATEKQIYIIQELAVMDLFTYTNKYKFNHKCTPEELVTIYYSIVQAMCVLHSQHIIHCDIKSNNILIYENGQVKLSDFTLSVKQLDNKFTHTICTPTHRPLESHLGLKWDGKVDIWSAGCTFYEICYQSPLFVNQSNDVDKKNLTKHKYKELIKNKYVNAILSWALSTQQDVSKYTFNNATTFHIGTTDIDKFIITMLTIDSEKRPSAFNLLQQQIFTPIKLTNPPINPQLIVPTTNKLSLSEEARVVRYIEQGITNKHVQPILTQHAYDLYCKVNLRQLSESYKALGAVFIANKVLYGNTDYVSKNISMDKLLEIEREMVHNLHFMLL
jgi:serine/threonine protein kinase